LKNDDPHIYNSLKLADYLIDGPYKKELRDITLSMRGSSNQNIIDLKNGGLKIE
jgi:anaerobic ribonucleoside-triphosphate reductase activating protein